MIVCVCKAVSEKRIRRAVDEGAISLRDLTRELGVGTCCGKCVPMARDVLGARLVQDAAAPMGMPAMSGAAAAA